MPTPTKYGDLTELATVENTLNGWMATRTFMFDGCDNSDPTSTVYTLLVDDSICPQYGDDHPSVVDDFGNPLQVCDVHGEAKSPTQIHVVVKYKQMSAIDQDASTPNNTNPCLLTVSSSMVEMETSIDGYGNKVQASWQPGVGTYDIQDSQGNIVVQNGVAGPAISDGTIRKQFPCMMLRYSRRETVNPVAKQQYIGIMNSGNFDVLGDGSVLLPTNCVLCTRIDGPTNDGGRSWIVDHEFQYRPNSPDGQGGVLPGWRAGLFYTVPTGLKVVNAGTSVAVAGAGDIPAFASDLNMIKIFVYADDTSTPFSALRLNG
jgi:hypothetical protein